MSKLSIPSLSDISSLIIYGITSFLGEDVEVSVVENNASTLTDGDKSVTGETEIIKYLFDKTGKSVSLNVEKGKNIETLNDQLAPVVYIDGGVEPTYADFYYYATLRKQIVDQKPPQRNQFCNVTRWFAHIQHYYERSSFPKVDFKISFNPKFVEGLFGGIVEEKEAPKQQKGEANQEKKGEQKQPPKQQVQQPKQDAQPAAAEIKEEVKNEQAGEQPQKSRQPREKKAQGQGQGQGAGRGRGQEKKAPPPPLSHLKIQIGRVIHVERHSTLQNLLVEKVDIGEAEPRTVVSGLANYISVEEFQGKLVVLITNLTPGEFAGVFSSGLVLCASDSTHEKVEILEPPQDAVVGELVRIQGDTNEADKEVNGKGFQKFVKGLETDADCKVVFKGAKVTTASGGEITVKSLAKSRIK